MRAEDDAAIEPEQQVLADRLARFEGAAVEALCDAFSPGPRMRRLRLDTLPDQRLQAPGRPVESVALRHVCHGNRTGHTCDEVAASMSPNLDIAALTQRMR